MEGNWVVEVKEWVGRQIRKGGLLLLAAIVPAPLFGGTARAEVPEAVAPAPREWSTHHSARINGQRVDYEAIAGEALIHDPEGGPGALLWSFSYIRRGAPNRANRPVAFVFNGGPGSASIWTHMGMIGPRRVVFADPTAPNQTAPFEIGDSEHSPLDLADLVFIDPIGTGFSRMLAGAREVAFLGVNQDARVTAEFIQQWLTRHGRWNSPRYLIGESYGTARAIAVADALMAGHNAPYGTLRGISLNGIVILGPAFEYGRPFGDGEDRRYVTGLLSMAATAWYYGKIDRSVATSLEDAVQQARAFAGGEYLTALHAGYALPQDTRERIARRLAELTGVAGPVWIANDLRIGLNAYQNMVLADRGLQVGAYDSRFSLPLAAAGRDPVADDPAMGQYTAGYMGALNQYMTSELSVHVNEPYIPINWSNVFYRWDRGAGPGVTPPQNFGTLLATVMRRSPQMRLLVAAGYYDFVTTVGDAEYVIAHSRLPADRVEQRNYGSGHMLYIGEEPAAAFGADLRAFLQR
jgi:carboxypeptidase C (cathepsin A)